MRFLSKLLLGCMLMQLTACGGSCERKAPDGTPASEPGGDVVLDWSASMLGWIGGFLLVGGILLAIASLVYPPLAWLRRVSAWLPAIGLGCVIGSSIVGWLADYYWLVVLLAILGGLGWLYLERAGLIERIILRVFKKKIDINGDGKIG